MNESLRELEMVWEHEPIGKCFHSFFEFSQTFTAVSETQRTGFQFLLENTAMKKKRKKTNCLLRSLKCRFSLLTPSVRQQLVLVLCFYRVVETLQCPRRH